MRRSFRHDAAAVEPDAAGAHLQDHARVVTDKEHGAAAADLAADLAEAAPLKMDVADRQHLIDQ